MHTDTNIHTDIHTNIYTDIHTDVHTDTLRHRLIDTKHAWPRSWYRSLLTLI